MSEFKIRPIPSASFVRSGRIQNTVFTCRVVLAGRARPRETSRIDQSRRRRRRRTRRYSLSRLCECGGAIARCLAAIRCYVRGTKARE